jgi:succinoglycan biosynthesis protein ExoM
MNDSAPCLLTVGICTHKRAPLLDRLLGRLALQQFPEPETVEVVVVDNDPDRSALPVLEHWATRLPVALRHDHVPQPNISVARNRVFQLARGQNLLLIDDDQYPDDPAWVVRMQQALQRHGADVVFAPILPAHDPAAPDWIQAGPFFDQPRYASGQTVGVAIARGGNVILRRACVPPGDEPFSVAYGKTGGEDSLFFKRIIERGGRVVWEDDAVIRESIPLDRATPRWLLRRVYRIGQTYVRTQCEGLKGGPRWARLAYFAVHALLVLGVSLLAALLSWPFSKTRAFDWLRRAVLQCGKLSSYVGLSYQEYR